MYEIKVAVSGINAVDNPGPGVGVARSLKEDKELNVTVYGLAYDAMEPGIYMDWVIDKSFIMSYPSGGRDALLERLGYIKNRHGLDMIIPNLDSELPIYTKYANEIEEMGIKVYVPTESQYKLRGKDKLEEVAKNMDIDLPKSKVVTSAQEVMEAVEDIGLPVMVKGAYYKAEKAYTTQEALNHFHKIAAEWGYPLIIQKVVKGEEMNIVGVGDGEGNTLGKLGIKKLWVTSQGKIWTGVTIKNDAMLKAVNKFIEFYKWKGPFELECMVDKGNVYLIEINPRFPAWSYFATGCGINLPSNLVRKAFGLSLNMNNDYEAGKLFVRYTYETITDMTAFQNVISKGEN
ncbi:MAG: ATP-grasp domain-containing protein [Melioribacteraceae bacterium]|nr:ATP-grasp domain-containing protein [Melioribacteraceae bacterium]MCF8411910.1 ATP-grasp domain-containing protein [Melioribacteraceae bacterium]